MQQDWSLQLWSMLANIYNYADDKKLKFVALYNPTKAHKEQWSHIIIPRVKTKAKYSLGQLIQYSSI